jgi:flavorubredoxin
VRDAKTALVDAVKGPFAGRLLARVAALVDPSRVDYVICNHAEPDHAGALPEVMKALPNATLVADARCLAALAEHFDTSGWKTRTVADGETLSLGRRTLRFIETPMVHWPESMFTYVVEEKLLFSMDAFGQHYASSGRFDDEVPVATVLDEAKTYYANIVMPYGKQVARVLEQAATLPIDTIAPAHGVIWRSHVPAILGAYADWSVCRPAAKVVVVYDTMWGSTAEMAEAIHDGASRPGVETVLMSIRQSNLTRIAAEMLDAATVAFGSSTLNHGMMPMAAAVLAYLKGLRPVGKAGFAFGSYGWGVGGPEAVSEHLAAMNWEVLREPLKARYRPTPEVLAACRAAGEMLAEKAKQMVG